MSQELFMIFLDKNPLKFYFNFGNLYLRSKKNIIIFNFIKIENTYFYYFF